MIIDNKKTNFSPNKGQSLRILCLSFWSPPLVRPQSILIGKMIPEWIQQGANPILVTYEKEERWNIDIPIFTIPEFTGLTGWKKNIPFSRFISQIRYFLRLRNQILPIVYKYDINLIYSFANPQDSNIIGAMIARKSGVPFVSHFCDPWADNPYKKFSLLSKLKVLCWENYIVYASTNITFTNERARDLVMKKFKKSHYDKGIVIPHCFDAKDYPINVQKREGKFILSYIGAFYQERNPEILFTALRDVLNKQPKLKTKFILQLIGCTNPYAGYDEKSLNALLIEYGLSQYTEIIPAVSYKKSLNYMKEADCLVVIDANFAESPFFPSKIVDYAGSETPIIGITPSDSPTALALADMGYRTFDYDDRDSLSEYLSLLLSNNVVPKLNKEILAKYDVRTVTKQLFRVFKEISN